MKKAPSYHLGGCTYYPALTLEKGGEMTDKALDFVKEIANDDPIEALDEINACKFCGSSWSEYTYDEYLANHALLANDRDAKDKYGWSLRNKHHDDDCLWVKANQILN